MIKNENPKNKKTVSQFSPLTLAYIGDSVYDLVVKEKLLHGENIPNGKLHRRATRFVSAVGQSKSVDILIPLLSENELSVYKRGRNCEVNPGKNSDIGEYHRATGFEALIGYLYLCGETERIDTFVNLIFSQFGEGELNDEKNDGDSSA